MWDSVDFDPVSYNTLVSLASKEAKRLARAIDEGHPFERVMSVLRETRALVVGATAMEEILAEHGAPFDPTWPIGNSVVALARLRVWLRKF